MNLNSRVRINISGNNINRFIKRLKNNNIEILNIKYISNKEIIIDIYYDDYEKLNKIKTIYKIKIISYSGKKNIKNKIISNKYIIISILISMILIYFLSNLIFKIEIVTNDSNMKNILLEDLKEYGIKKYNFKKDYIEIQNIKYKILNKHKDDIEWLEINSIGTKYIVKYEPRIKNKTNESNDNRNIVALKDSIIVSMDIKSGQIVKDVNAYVKKGDVIVSGYITFNNEVKDIVSSEGIVYGEVWYEVLIKYPFNYYENIETGNVSKSLCINILNKKIEIFNKYKDKNIVENIILKNNILPIYIAIETQRETNKKIEINNKNNISDKAISKAKEKLETNLNDGEYIKDYKILSTTYDDVGVNLRVFFTIVENITEYQNIY